MQLLTTTTISWNKTEKIDVMILKVYVDIYIILLIVYPQFGKQSLLAPLIMSGVVRVLISKSFRLSGVFRFGSGWNCMPDIDNCPEEEGMYKPKLPLGMESDSGKTTI